MSEADDWLDTYEQNLAGLRLRPLYWLGVPLLVVGFVGLLWSLPVPRELTEISPLLNWGSVFLMAAMVYYFIISLPLAIGMLPVVAAVILAEVWLALVADWLEPAAALLTVAGVAGIVAGHAGRGGFRAACRDIQLLMIAPLWALSRLYRKLGIPR